MFPFPIAACRPLAAALFLAFVSGQAALAQDDPATQPPHYVGSETCTTCHEEATAHWIGSHHQLAWTMPGPDTVIADFDGTSFDGAGMHVEFSQDEDGYHAAVTEADGSRAAYDIHSVVGIAPLQQYLIETEPGKLQSFDVVWDAAKGEWYHLYGDNVLPPADGLHWTGPYKNWNARCAECHATGYKKNYDPATGRYQSTEVEIGVGCEACHGPGSAHVEWTTTQGSGPANASYGLVMSPDASPEDWIQQCGTCHSRREPLGDGNPMPGAPYHDNFRLLPLTPGLYHADGQILDEVYVLGSFLQSKMYDKGVTCTNCHDPHSMQLVAEGNTVCTQCHSPAGNPDFPSLPLKVFDGPEHTFHEPGTAGAECKNCHMVEQVYMGIDWRADHSFRIPRPDLDARTGAPDACTTCHTDRTPEWAAAEIQKRFPESTHRGSHYGTLFARAQRDPAGTQRGLIELAQDPVTPDIVRATALYLMTSAAGPRAADGTVALLDDPNPLVREHAIPLQGALPDQQAADRIAPLLRDPSRNVRLAALRSLLQLQSATLSPEAMADRDKVMAELSQSLGDRFDFPETQLVMGGMALSQRQFPAALSAFHRAVEMDPQLTDAWSLIIRLTAALQGPEAGQQQARAALAANPDVPALQELAAQLGITQP
ncbi:multiheme c-type cytochrome [Chachezhania sediminis]|uniref:multiheme c-type cytochrome n=1 Tax=Chachezhania sediminis TaxID=2599291 RepID=UPI001E63C36F|nr:multiheme c-type cytochrome [Chachezhania sediminis]